MRPTKPQLYDIWQEEKPVIPELDWRMQLINYVAQYPTQAAAERHKAVIEVERKKQETIQNMKRI